VNDDTSKKLPGCSAFACSFKSFLRPFQEHILSKCIGHLIFPYTQTPWCLAICSTENNSWQPRCLLAQGYLILLAMFSRATPLVTENSALHVGQHETLSLHLLQMVWPFTHSSIGGTMHSMHRGHSRSFHRTSSTARDKSAISRT